MCPHPTSVGVLGGASPGRRRHPPQSAQGVDNWPASCSIVGSADEISGMDDQPFLGMQAIRSGQVTDHQLRTRYRAVYRNVYLARDTPLTAELRARAAWLWAGPEATLTGVSAAAVLGAKWLDPGIPAELIRADRHSPAGITVRSYALEAGEVRRRRGMRVTTAVRTVYDIGRTLDQHRAIPILDALMNATGVRAAEVMALAERRAGFRGFEGCVD